MTELIVDNFAGGGGASTGIEIAVGRSVDIAINHDPDAIKMHKTNHPNTKHYCEDVWQVDPVEACGGQPVGLDVVLMCVGLLLVIGACIVIGDDGMYEAFIKPNKKKNRR